MNIQIKHIEYYLPGSPITNSELGKLNPNWDMDKTADKTGVYSRHFAKPDETAYDLAIQACEKLFANNSIDKDEIDGIIVCTQSPDYIMPSNAFLIHKHFNLKHNVLAFDINLACSGYSYGLVLAASLINSAVAKNILLVTSDTYSKFINKGYRSAYTLFGDGAAVTMLSASPSSQIIDSALYTSGKDYKVFYVPAGGVKLPKSPETSIEHTDNSGNIRSDNDIYMDGFSVWKFIQATVPKQINELLSKNNLTKDDISMFFFHQASKMTLESLTKAMKIPEEKAFSNIEYVGNTVSSSIPICIKDAIDKDLIKRGDLLLLSGFGVGLSWGSVLLRY